jgi:hypothetical protein
MLAGLKDKDFPSAPDGFVCGGKILFENKN